MDRARAGKLVGDRYEIIRPLASGGMGEVLLARQTNIDRLVVVKRAVNQHSARELRALVDEAHVAARLHHPNIVSVLDVIDAGQNPMVVLELVAGVSLRELIDRAPDGLPVDVALAIITDVLRGLAYAHSVGSADDGEDGVIGVVHRDVKPRNVMVTFAGVTKLIDFGISRWLEAAPAEHTTSGTRGYMAPEQERGEYVDGRADQFSAGITLREMLTGSPLFNEDPDEPLPRVFASPELAAIVERATASRPEDRYPTCNDAIDALERFAASRGIQPSAMQVERWMSRHFADRKKEHEGEASLSPRRRVPTIPPVPLHQPYQVQVQTAVARPQRKPNRSAVVFSSLNAGDPGDEWLAPIAERMVRRSLRDREDRRFHVGRGGGDEATPIELAFSRADDQVRIQARGEDGRVVASVSATSVASAARAIADALASELGAGLPTVEPDPAELAEMRRIGASSIELFRRYRALLHAFYATNVPDTIDLAAAARRLVADDPSWMHAHVLLAMLEGITTDAAHAAILAARKAASTSRDAASATRDPAGIGLLGAVERFLQGDLEATFDLADAVVGRDNTDLLAGSLLLLPMVLLQRTEEAAAMARRLHALHPELVFGCDLAETLRRAGRDADADRVIRDWAAATPEGLVARVELVRLEARAGRLEEARARAKETLAIHGGRDEALPDLFEAMVASDQLSEARAIADRMLVGSPLARARARYRVALIAVFEGRFAAAYDIVRRAIPDNRRYGVQSELLQCLELARSIAPLVADADAHRRYTEELANVCATVVGDVGTAAATRFELALLDRNGPPPSIDAYLKGLEDGPVRDVARRRMLRAAAAAGCGDPEAAVAAGFSAFEENTASLLALGLCARRVGELELARRSLERATHRWSSINNNQNSPYHAVLARFHLGGVLADMGDRAGARAAYESFLRCWSEPDRPIPEVTATRWLLEEAAMAAR